MEDRHLFAFIAEEKSADGGSRKAVDESDHSINFIISSDKLDRDSERVEVAAIAAAIKDFAKNPCALACHLHRLSDGRPPVIGSWDTDSFKAKAHHSEMRLKFAVDTELGEQYWRLYSARHMRAVSIGFRILDGHEEVEGGKRSYVISKIELYEISCVAVGANREALSKAAPWYQGQPSKEEIFKRNAIGSDATAIFKNEINERFDALELSLDEIKSILADSDDYARRQLGAVDDPQSPAGDLCKTAEQLLHQLQHIKNQ